MSFLLSRAHMRSPDQAQAALGAALSCKDKLLGGRSRILSHRSCCVLPLPHQPSGEVFLQAKCGVLG